MPRPPFWNIQFTPEPFADFSAKPSSAYGWSITTFQNDAYIYGWTSHGASVARVPANAIGDFSQWRFFTHGQWQSDSHAATPLFPDRPPEGTVRWIPSFNQFILIYSEGLSGDIILRQSPTPWGPWTEPHTIYHCPESARSHAYYSYSAKAHPEISSPGELILTYAVNSNTFSDLFHDPTLYWPQFLRLKLSSLAQ